MPLQVSADDLSFNRECTKLFDTGTLTGATITSMQLDPSEGGGPSSVLWIKLIADRAIPQERPPCLEAGILLTSCRVSWLNIHWERTHLRRVRPKSLENRRLPHPVHHVLLHVVGAQGSVCYLSCHDLDGRHGRTL
jgi:hypothetical protein